MDDSGIILIADDDESDVLLFQRALRIVGVVNPTFVVETGEEVIDYLAGRNQFSNRAAFPLPCIVFLDAKMPVYDCIDVLKWLQGQDEQIRMIPIVVVSGSIRPAEQKQTLELGAKAFYPKPLEGADLRNCLELLRTCLPSS